VDRRSEMPSSHICENCLHGLEVVDNRVMGNRWVCLKYLRVLDDPTFMRGRIKGCLSFESKVPQTPYLGKPGSRTLSGRPLFTELHLIEEIRLAMIHVENLLKALELQPRQQFGPDDPGAELRRSNM